MRNNKRFYRVAAAVLAAMLMGCGAKEAAETDSSVSSWEPIPVEETAPEEEVEEQPQEEEEEEGYTLPEGMYFSELTGEPISETIKDQRPISMMVDNDSRALPHFGLTECDVVYELMNSTANDRITRLMGVQKDWGAITKLGSIRSTRPTNVILASEWNSILCHDGGPFYIDEYLAASWAPPHLSGYFSRVNNGKATEFTEFCLEGEMAKRISDAGISATYTANPGNHFVFADYGTKIDLSGEDGAMKADKVTLPFKNTSSTLQYNSETGTYDYYEFGAAAQDGASGKTLTFENVILQNCSFTQYDEHGYMIYNCVGSDMGYYLTEGYAIPIYWVKNDFSAVTHYYDSANNEITVNTGKTYISLIPSDTWGQVGIQ